MGSVRGLVDENCGLFEEAAPIVPFRSLYSTASKGVVTLARAKVVVSMRRQRTESCPAQRIVAEVRCLLELRRQKWENTMCR